MDEQWRLQGDRFSDSFNPRRAIVSDQGRIGYLKVLREDMPEDPWLEQWANEQIVSELARLVGIPAVEASAGNVEGERGAITVFLEGRKLSEFELEVPWRMLIGWPSVGRRPVAAPGASHRREAQVSCGPSKRQASRALSRRWSATARRYEPRRSTPSLTACGRALRFQRTSKTKGKVGL